MASAVEYAQWIINNADKKGSPEFNTVAEAYKRARQLEAFEIPAPTPLPMPELPDRREASLGSKFKGGLGRAYESTKGMVADVLPALVGSALGQKEYAAQQLAEYGERMKAAEEKYPTAFKSYTDVRGVGDVPGYVAESLGELIPDMVSLFTGTGAVSVIGRRFAVGAARKLVAEKAAETVAKRGLTGEAAQEFTNKFTQRAAPIIEDIASKGTQRATQAGVLGSSYALNTPDVFQNIAEKTGEQSPYIAAAMGVPIAMLDSFLPSRVLDKLGFAGKAKLATAMLEESNAVPGSFKMAALKELGKTIPMEGLTESAQEALTVAAEMMAGSKDGLFSQESIDRYINAGLKGAIGGGVFGTPGAIASGLQARDAAKRERAGDRLLQGETGVPETDTGAGGEGAVQSVPPPISTGAAVEPVDVTGVGGAAEPTGKPTEGEGGVGPAVKRQRRKATEPDTVEGYDSEIVRLSNKLAQVREEDPNNERYITRIQNKLERYRKDRDALFDTQQEAALKKIEMGGAEVPGAKSPVVEVPTAEAAGAQASYEDSLARYKAAVAELRNRPVNYEAPGAKSPVVEVPTAEAPGAKSPVVEVPTAEAAGAKSPVVEVPTAEAPGAKSPVTEVPTEAPAAYDEKELVDLYDTLKDPKDRKTVEAEFKKIFGKDIEDSEYFSYFAQEPRTVQELLEARREADREFEAEKLRAPYKAQLEKLRGALYSKDAVEKIGDLTDRLNIASEADLGAIKEELDSLEGQKSDFENLAGRLNAIIDKANAAKEKQAVGPRATMSLKSEAALDLIDEAQDYLDYLNDKGDPAKNPNHKRNRIALEEDISDLENQYPDIFGERKRALKPVGRTSSVADPSVIKNANLLAEQNIQGVLKSISEQETEAIGATALSNTFAPEINNLKAINSLIETYEAKKTDFVANLQKDLKISADKALNIINRLTVDHEIFDKDGNFKPEAANAAQEFLTQKVFAEDEISRILNGSVLASIADELSKIKFNSKVFVEGINSDTVKASRLVESVKEKKGLAAYLPAYDVLVFTNKGLSNRAILHELLHAATVKLVRLYETSPKELTENQRDAVKHIYDLYEFAKKRIKGAENRELKNVYEFIAYGLTDKSFQERLANFQSPSLAKYTIDAARDLWSAFTAAIARLFNLATPKPVIEKPVIEKLQSRFARVYKGYEGNIALELAEAVKDVLAAETEAIPKQPALYVAPTVKQARVFTDKTVEQKTKELSAKVAKDSPRHNVMQAIKAAFNSPSEAYINTVRKLQNDRVVLKVFQDQLSMAGKLISGVPGFNNLYSLITLSAGKAHAAMTQYLDASMTDLRDSVEAYAKEKGLNINDALGRLHVLTMAMSEKERRHIQFLKLVPLTPAAHAKRVAIFKELGKDRQMTDAEVKKLRNELEDLVANYKDPSPNGMSGISATSSVKLSHPGQNIFDETSDNYRVVSDVTHAAFENYRKEYASEYAKSPAFRKMVDPQKGILKNLKDATTELNRQSNYHSKQVDNIVRFYGYKNYVPFKGKPDSDPDAGVMLNGEYRDPGFTEGAFSAEGRFSDSDNPVLQLMIDATKSAIRVGRADVTQAIKNISEQGLTDTQKTINGKTVKVKGISRAGTIKYNERDTYDVKKFSGPNYVFHYAPNGDIEVYRMHNAAFSNAVRRAFRTANPLIEIANYMTSAVGQFHTRYNPSFAPMNFVRDALTNAFTMSAEMGLPEAGRYLGEISSQVVRFGLGRAFRVAKAYAEGDTATLNRLAKSDPFVKDMIEYLVVGGRVSHVQGLAINGQMRELNKSIGRSGIIRSVGQINKWIDIWTDMFELTSRTAAYRVARDNQRAKDPKGNPEGWKVEGVAYAKNLANFEQVGEWGRGLGAAYMFFRPAATGAVRAIDALLPAFQNTESLVARLPDNIRNDKAAVERFRKNHAELKKRAQRTAITLAGAGATIYLMSMLMAGDDEQDRNIVATDDMARWTRYLRLPFGFGDNEFIQLPWGYGFGAFAAAGAQIASMATGNQKLIEGFGNLAQIGADSFLPLPVSKMPISDNPLAWFVDSTLPSVARPFVEYVMNVDSLGRQIYNNRQTRAGDAYTGGDSVPEIYKSAAKMLFDVTDGAVDWSPGTMYFFANNYVDGVSRIVHEGANLGLSISGEKKFDPKTDLLFLNSFFGRKGNYDAKEYAALTKEIEGRAKILKQLEDDPERLYRRMEDNPMEATAVKLFNQMNGGQLKKLREEANRVRASRDMPLSEKQEYLKDIIESENLVKRNIIDMLKAYEIEP